MPIREYSCPRCGWGTEIIEPLDDAPEVCDKCGGHMVKLVSKTGGRWRYADATEGNDGDGE